MSIKILSRRSGLSVPLLIPIALYLIACLVLGGASQNNELWNLILRTTGALLITSACLTWYLRGTGEGCLRASILIGIIVVLHVLQLLPLPPGMWDMLPGRNLLVSDLVAAGVAPVWRPLSLTPEATVNSLFGIIPFAAVLLAASCISSENRQSLWVGTSILAFVSVTLGALQLTTGGMRLYGNEAGPAVGFFANRNHWAAWLVASLPILAFVMSRRPGSSYERPLLLAIALAMFVALITGVAISGSRAATVLVIPAVIGSSVLAWRGMGTAARIGRMLLPSAVITGVVIIAFFGAWAAIERFGTVETDLRFGLWAESVKIAVAYLPFGTGAGSFSAVFMTEETSAVLTSGFVNQAHSDWIEIFVEFGLVALAPVVLALTWVAKGMRSGSAASYMALALALLLLASLVDYPLRTPALQALSALLLAELFSRPRTMKNAV